MKAIVVFITGMITCVMPIFGQSGEFTLAKQKFTFLLQHTSEGDVERQTLSIFHQNEDKPLLVSLLKEVWGDSNSMSVMVGDYDVSDSTVVLYHFWAKAGDAPVSPYGARIQTYGMDANKKLILKGSMLYIETMSDNYILQCMSKQDLGYHRGCLYLHYPPKNATEKHDLNAYLAGAEKEYGSKFIIGKDADILLDKVRKRLSPALKQYTGDWNIRYEDNGFGYKK